MLSRLPMELLELIVRGLTIRGMRSLVLTAKWLSGLYNDRLLRGGMAYRGVPMTWAAATGHVALATRILDLDERPTGVARRWTQCYRLAVLVAAKMGQAGILTLLLHRLPDLDINKIQDQLKRPAMWFSGLGGHIDALRVLVESGRVDPNQSNQYGETALHVATERNHPDAVRALLRLGADPRATDIDCTAIAIVAARKGHVDILDILAAHDTDLVLHGRGEYTPLVAAVTWGHVDAVRALVAYGADLSAPQSDCTLLWGAANCEHPEMVEYLLQHPATAVGVDIPGRGETPLMNAVRLNASSAIVRALLRAGANPHAVNEQGRSVIRVAMTPMDMFGCVNSGPRTYGRFDSNRADIVSELLRAGADPSRRQRPLEISDVDDSIYPGSPLALSAFQGSRRLVRWLLSLGDVLDWHAGKDVDTAPLACAARNGRFCIVKKLVAAGVSPNALYAVDDSAFVNMTSENKRRIRARVCGPAAFIALDTEHVDMFRWLLKSGKVDLTARNANGMTLVQAALEGDQGEMLDALREVGCVPSEEDVQSYGYHDWSEREI